MEFQQAGVRKGWVKPEGMRLQQDNQQDSRPETVFRMHLHSLKKWSGLL
jgi:hypothetical protein